MATRVSFADGQPQNEINVNHTNTPRQHARGASHRKKIAKNNVWKRPKTGEVYLNVCARVCQYVCVCVCEIQINKQMSQKRMRHT